MAINGPVAIIDLNAITENISAISRIAGKNCKIIAVIKADGYGHGSIAIAKHLETIGIDYFAVSRIDEALKLRENGINSNILLLGYLSKNDIETAIKKRLAVTIYDYSIIPKIKEISRSCKIRCKTHIKIDTGMHRLGIPIDNSDLINEIYKLKKENYIELEGIFSHLSDAGSIDRNYTKRQVRLFRQLIATLESKGISFPLIHIANSAGIIQYPDLTGFNAIRPGIAIYGLYPSINCSRERIALKPAMSIKTIVVQIKRIKKGSRVGYGCSFTAPKDMDIAIVSIGYGDGFSRKATGIEILIKGKRYKTIGRISMDLTIVDIGDNIGIKPGDVATIIGKDGDEIITVDDIANKLKTINYEIISNIAHRIPRIYKKS